MKIEPDCYRSHRIQIYAMVFFILCIAALLRFAHLGDADFGLDEILHVHVAKELAEGKPPVLPSGQHYDRSLLFSSLVSVAGILGGFNEFALRVPSVMLGILLVFLVYWLTARWFSVPAGLVAAFMVTFSPIEIAHSREVRMYALFQCLFLLVLFFFYEGMNTSPHKSSSGNKVVKRIQEVGTIFQIRPFFLLTAMGLFFLAFETQHLILPGLSGVLVYIFVMGGLGWLMKDVSIFNRLKYSTVCLVIVVGFASLTLLIPEIQGKIVQSVTKVPPWNKEVAQNWQYYRHILFDEYPIVFGSLAVSMGYCLAKKPGVSLFVCLAFAVPFLIHSIVFQQKTYRYILYILPLMYMVAGFSIAEIFKKLWISSLKLNEEQCISPEIYRIVLVGCMCLVIGGLLVNMPWFMRTLKDYRNDFAIPHVTDVQHHKWKSAMKYVSERATLEDVMICAYPLLCRYYGATQPLYFMNDAYISTNIAINRRNAQGQLVDYTMGVIVLETVEDVMRVIESHESGWVVTYRWRNDYFWTRPDRPASLGGTFPGEVLDYLQQHYQLESVPDAPNMAIWRWKRKTLPYRE